MKLPSYPFWPNNMPFHEGEVFLQKKFGVHSRVLEFAPRFIRPFMPDQHRDFYTNQPFLLAGARDSRGKMWATVLANGEGRTDFIASPSPFSLSIDAAPVPGDALRGAFRGGDDLAILGIEFESKRRNRVNGRVVAHTSKASHPDHSNGIEFQVGMSFGNCPQYIKPRQWWKNVATTCDDDDGTAETPIQRSEQLSSAQIRQIEQSETLFVASGYRGEGENPAYGNDVSHRGGPKGWITVQDANTIILPDFSGNDMYNTLGNIVMDNRFGVTIPLFESGGMIQMTGLAIIDYDGERANELVPGALRLVIFKIEEVVTVADGSLPINWSTNKEQTSRKVQVVKKIKESDDVTSFHLRPVEDTELWDYKPGQHLPIVLEMDGNKIIERTYSLSGSPSSRNLEYRISVKREPFGLASRFLHDEVKEGDLLDVNRPAGDFVLNEGSDRDLVLISAGVGITPVLSMLHVYSHIVKRRRAFWVHGGRDGNHHPFRGEVQRLQKMNNENITSHVVYSKPGQEDAGMYNSVGRITPALLAEIVPDLLKAEFYMCGPASFMADMESGLQQLGVDAKWISYETF